MRLTLRLDPLQLRNWHVALAERLSALPEVELGVETHAVPTASTTGVETLFGLESIIHGLARNGPAARADARGLAAFQAIRHGEPDVTLDLAAGAEPASGRHWRLTFNGVAGEAALLGLLIEGEAPLVAIVDGERIVASGRPGTEHGGVLLAAFEDVLARITTLIVAALAGAASPRPPVLPGETSERTAGGLPGVAGLAKLAAKRLASTVIRRLYVLCYHAPHWRTGWRKLEGPDLFALRRHPDSGWSSLPDDGARYYADPFPIEHRGRLTLFVEEYDHRLGKGLISAVAFDEHGPMGTPAVVLEQPGHLSYPFVFARDGEVWMVPESCSTGRIDLFRATAFPRGWVHERTLVTDVVASDATLVEHDGRWWMFATVRDGGGAFSDALHLWSAPDFRGPFTPHPRNPVLIDIASARPAGRIVARDGALLRPVQDCRRGYGAALAIARVTRLDDDGYGQEVETILTSGPHWPGRRIHTLNSAGGFEFIDGSRLARRRLLR